jgi:8-oxo-dGTP diphosphatase
MAEALIFGSPELDTQHTERRAAYVVVISGDKVATVQSHEKYFLPGGGSLPLETPEDTVVREVFEELGRGLHLIRKIGEAVQYFYSSDDDRHYEMRASFFAGELTDELCAGAHQLYWLSTERAIQSCFHECHAWAISQA